MARSRFLAHAAGVLTITAALLTAVVATPASACSCQPGTEGDRYQRAAFVFAGTVLRETLDAGDPAQGYDDVYRYTVIVRKEYKGDVPRRVEVVTSTIGSMCGIRLTTGVEYLVFAHGDSSDGKVESTLCSGTRPASSGPPVTTGTSGTTTAPPTATCATAAP
ncbi:hypothetical protein ACIGNX_12440 [Actinosynnema sp. NPDC053489]|uniref:hypothetical protein n=1 Tax=Actinosynnema sp. NPDC053489 TaxID=3363916 RepID=UPI0037CCAE21